MAYERSYLELFDELINGFDKIPKIITDMNSNLKTTESKSFVDDTHGILSSIDELYFHSHNKRYVICTYNMFIPV